MSERSAAQGKASGRPLVALFATCLVDLFRPSVGFASLTLLQRAGCEVVVPPEQTCCGQPAYNNGDRAAIIALAKQTIAMLEPADYVVIPSGSCAGMLSEHYPRLFDGEWHDRALAVASKTFELTSFLRDIAPLPTPEKLHPPSGKVAYHDSCAGLREMQVREQPRALLKSTCGVEVVELQQRDVCCGFGGTFCAKMPEISAKMADDKLKDAASTGATILTGGDLGCLMSLAGRAQRTGQNLEMRHVAELLVGDQDTPPVGGAD